MPSPQTVFGHRPPVPAVANQHNLRLLKAGTRSPPSFSSRQTKLLAPRSREVRQNVAEVSGGWTAHGGTRSAMFHREVYEASPRTADTNSDVHACPRLCQHPSAVLRQVKPPGKKQRSPPHGAQVSGWPSQRWARGARTAVPGPRIGEDARSSRRPSSPQRGLPPLPGGPDAPQPPGRPLAPVLAGGAGPDMAAPIPARPWRAAALTCIRRGGGWRRGGGGGAAGSNDMQAAARRGRGTGRRRRRQRRRGGAGRGSGGAEGGGAGGGDGRRRRQERGGRRRDPGAAPRPRGGGGEPPVGPAGRRRLLGTPVGPRS